MRPKNLLVCVVVLIAGCGGEEAATGGEETMPAAEWAHRVEELCDEHANRAERDGVEIAQEVQSEGGSQEEMVARVLERSVELTEPMLDKVKAMPPPEGKERSAENFDKQMRVAMEKTEAMAADLRNGGADMKRSAQEVLEAALPARATARDLDIHACIPQGDSLNIK